MIEGQRRHEEGRRTWKEECLQRRARAERECWRRVLVEKNSAVKYSPAGAVVE